MTVVNAHSAEFDQRYDSHLRYLKLEGLQTKTIEASSRAIRSLGVRCDQCIDDPSGEQFSR